LEHGGAKLEVWRGQSAGRLENEFMLEVNWSTVAAHGRKKQRVHGMATVRGEKKGGLLARMVSP
jgi:hypothetical protein